MPERTAHPCPQCQIGHLHLSQAPYVQVYEGMLISVPDMPAEVCDVCGYQEFEREMVVKVDTLIGHSSIQRPTPRSAGKSSSSDLVEVNPSQRLKP